MLISRLVILLGLSGISLLADQSQAERKPIFTEKTDGFRQIQEAARMAETDGRRLLLLLGAEWCVWCHRLHELLHTNPVVRECLERHYILVPIQIDKDINVPLQEHFDNPRQHGLPVLLILNSSGGVLSVQETGSLEEGQGHAPRKVLAFLEKWAPTRGASFGQSRISWESITLKTPDLFRLWRFYRYGMGLASDWDGQSPRAQFDLNGVKLELQASTDAATSSGNLAPDQLTWRMQSGPPRGELLQRIRYFGGTDLLEPATRIREDCLLVTDPDGNTIRLLLAW